GFVSSVMVNIMDATGLGGTYRSVAPPFETALAIRREGGANLMTWAGGGQLRRADTPAGPWQTLAPTNSYAVRSTIPTGFYGVARPRPVNVYVPSGYDGSTKLPLVILLHAYAYTGAAQESYMRFQPLAETKSFFYCYPDSANDTSG